LGSASKRAPRAFDALAISISVQQEALNLPAALRHSGLEMACGPRLADARHPFICSAECLRRRAFFAWCHGARPNGWRSGGRVCFGDGLLWLQELYGRRLRRVKRGNETGMAERLAREVPDHMCRPFMRTDHGASRVLGGCPLASRVSI
jgi:hypothetical protein